MTTEFQHEQVLEIIGLERTRKDMVVLGALLKAQKAPTDFIDFATIREQLTLDEGSRKGKDPLIYRSLSVLEKEGFVKKTMITAASRRQKPAPEVNWPG